MIEFMRTRRGLRALLRDNQIRHILKKKRLLANSREICNLLKLLHIKKTWTENMTFLKLRKRDLTGFTRQICVCLCVTKKPWDFMHTHSPLTTTSIILKQHWCQFEYLKWLQTIAKINGQLQFPLKSVKTSVLLTGHQFRPMSCQQKTV